jgi:hypothetical protein
MLITEAPSAEDPKRHLGNQSLLSNWWEGTTFQDPAQQLKRDFLATRHNQMDPVT